MAKTLPNAANPLGRPVSAVLPLPPLDYDVQYMNTIVRVLNFMIQQLQNPGPLVSNQLTISDRDKDTVLIINPQEKTETLTFSMTNLPISTTGSAPAGLGKGQVWVDNSTAGKYILNITPWE